MYRKKEEISNLHSLNNDPIETYFECITSCDITDGQCISKCVEILKDNEN